MSEPKSPSLVEKFASRFNVDAGKLLATLKETAFKVKEGTVSDHQMMALLVVADQYGLNPFTREIFAFPDKQNGIVPVVSVDGWSRIINEHKQLDGIEFVYSEETIAPGVLPGLKYAANAWIECVIYRKDRSRPTCAREYLEEVYRAPFIGTTREGKSYSKEGAWQTHTRRFHRHKALIQCARIAFGFAGIYDEDEARRIVDVTSDAAVIEREPLRNSIQRRSGREAPPPALEDNPTNETTDSLMQLLSELQGAESDERIDYLTGLAREQLSESGLEAFNNAAANRMKHLAEEA